MAYIYLYQSIVRNPKAKRLSRKLGIKLAEAIGSLSCLWLWAIDYAKDGYLDKFEAWEIADAAIWEGDPDKFVDALKSSGWITDENGSQVLNDWREYGGKMIEDKTKEAERKKKEREAKKSSGRTN